MTATAPKPIETPGYLRDLGQFPTGVKLRWIMRRTSSVALMAVILCLGVLPLCKAEDLPQPTRKVLVRVTPVYPELARRMQLSGTIRIVVVVAPDGKVKYTKPLGGNPLMIQAAEDALVKWKWQPAGGESQEIIELSFRP